LDVGVKWSPIPKFVFSFAGFVV